MPALELEFVLTAQMGEQFAVGRGRSIAGAPGGTVVGERINGRLVGPGGDWAVFGRDGWGQIDARMQIQTDDGAVLYLTYGGLMELTDAVRAALRSGAGTAFEDQYLRTAPRIETGDERYQWATRCLFVGEGRLIPGPAVEYRVYRVT